MTLKEEDLKKIYQWLLTQISAQDRNWLEICRGWKWKDKNNPVARKVFKNRYEQFSWMILDILDCKKGRINKLYLGKHLLKKHVIEMACLCGIDFSMSDKKELILYSILQKIKEV